MNDEKRLLAPTFVFRFSQPCYSRKIIWDENGADLETKHTIPSFAELDGRPIFGAFRAAWNNEGLSFHVHVKGKKQKPWCRDSRVSDSDGLHIWLDTRDTHNIHRASRYCHHFAFLPMKGVNDKVPFAALVPINRAREEPKLVAPHEIPIRSELRSDGYVISAHLPAHLITGFDPSDHPRLGFYYAIIDRELGWQTFSLGPEFPVMEDPSLWGTLELVK